MKGLAVVPYRKIIHGDVMVIITNTHIKDQRSKIISAHLHSLFQGTSLHIHNCTLQDYLNCFYKSLRSCTD